MKTLSLRVPPHLERLIREAAASSNRSADEEALRWLDAEGKRRERAAEKLRRIEELHERLNIPPASSEFIRDAIDEGRP